MPIYRNNSLKYVGVENLSIPPKTENYGSIFYYNIDELVDMDREPQYNPIKLLKYYNIESENDTTVLLDLDWDLIKKDFFIYITTLKYNHNSLMDIKLYFNSLNNEPPVVLNNGMFCINNTNRIKKMFFVVSGGVKCEILVNVSDKYFGAHPSIGYGSDVKDWG